MPRRYVCGSWACSELEQHNVPGRLEILTPLESPFKYTEDVTLACPACNFVPDTANRSWQQAVGLKRGIRMVLDLTALERRSSRGEAGGKELTEE